MMVKRSTTVWCLNPLMWLKQCNKPAMTGNGLSMPPTKKCWFFWGMVRFCIDHWEFTHQKLWEFTHIKKTFGFIIHGMVRFSDFSCRDDHVYWIKRSLGHLDPSSWHHPVGISPTKRTSCNQGTLSFQHISAVWHKSRTTSRSME